MDISDISKVASKKRMNYEVEKLREKVSRETAKIIKLKVAQDTAYWDLKEKLQQVEANHERLQQNMVEVQMQLETVSGRYQDELRLRPETLNRLSGTRGICDVLEEYATRLKATAARGRADRDALAAAYSRAASRVQVARRDHALRHDRARLLLHDLRDKMRLTAEHHGRATQYLTAARLRSEARLEAAQRHAEAARAQLDELRAARADLVADLAGRAADLDRRDEIISGLRRDARRLADESESRSADMKAAVARRDEEVAEAGAARAAAERECARLRERLGEAQERRDAAERECARLGEQLGGVRAQLAAAERERDELRERLGSEHAQRDAQERARELLEAELQVTRDARTESERLASELAESEADRLRLATELSLATREVEEAAGRARDATAAGAALQSRLDEVEAALASDRERSERRAAELSAAAGAAERELSARAATIARLMGDVSGETEARARLEAALATRGAELEAAADEARRRDARLHHLERLVRSKDEELAGQVTVVLEIRDEKERLQEKIRGMRSTIDNIQKELTGREAPGGGVESRERPEHDDNAVELRPPRPRNDSEKDGAGASAGAAAGRFAAPRSEPRQLDRMLYSFLSDSSMDADALDPAEVSRRFEAMSRGPAPPPRRERCAATGVSLSQMKHDLKMKSKTFFKSKRPDGKARKTK